MNKEVSPASQTVIKEYISKISAEVNKEVKDLHQGTLTMVFAGYNIDPEDEYMTITSYRIYPKYSDTLNHYPTYPKPRTSPFYCLFLCLKSF